MDADGLRAECAKHLRLRDVPQEVWKALEDTGMVEDTLVDIQCEVDAASGCDGDTLEGLLEVAKTYYRLYEAGAKGVLKEEKSKDRSQSGTADAKNNLPPAYRTGAIEHDLYLNPNERQRATVVSDALACLAARMLEVRMVRKDVLGSRLLSHQEAETFVVSPATRFLSTCFFRYWNISLIQHKASLSRWTTEWIPTPRLDTLQNDRTLIYPDIQIGKLWHYEVRAKVWFEPLGPWIETRIIVGDPNDVPEAPFMPRYAVDNWKDPFPAIFPQTPVNTLRLVSRVLAYHLPWDEAEAAWFILTGERPLVQPLRLGSRPPHTVLARDGFSTARAKPVGETVMTIEPWVSDDTVKATYRDIQKRRLGRDNRPLQDRNIAVFAFVLQNWPEDESEPDWKDLMARWNASQGPGWRYDKDWMFKRDFSRAEEKLVPGAATTMPKGPMFSRLYYQD